MKKRKSQRAIGESSPVASGSNAPQTPKQSKRPRSPTPTKEESSPKRSRLTHSRPENLSPRKSTRNLTTEPSPRRSARKPQKELSIVPPSEDENDDIQIIDAPPISQEPQRIEQDPLEDDTVQPHVEERMPAHRARMANPLVKRLGDLDDDALRGSKGKGKDATNGSSTSSLPAKRRKPGPGRSSEGMSTKSTSSLLTFEKGELKSVKGKFVASKTTTREKLVVENNEEDIPIIVDDTPPPQPPPTGQELLQIATQGVEDAEELQNFEEGENAPDSVPSNEPASLLQRRYALFLPCKHMSHSFPGHSLSLAKDSLFPSTWTPAAFTNVWTKRPTIFGPLGLGSDNRSADATNSTTIISEGYDNSQWVDLYS